ncbi:uncharacterized protein LOC115632748 [Scaptodrosophila lebanonensis]|uniref:MORN repeat-containing protein 5 n=1 Tax=Drosophila lebanonensis TaxID=7225 RepID=A0A6J2UBJ8_DROLE|nr:uncharacterized protein LOC115632748 [Scaptodrosophila lebanonensis]
MVDTTLQNFLTHSTYEGAWIKKVHAMDGFGTYRFPDGSEYRGYFRRGRFHGFGQLKMAAQKFTMKGEFFEGKLKKIADMWFEDGLHLNGKLENGDLNCEDWQYLSPYDRRYQNELKYGQQPVGPTLFLTGNPLTRPLDKHSYDAEEGIFHSKTGWLINRTPPFDKSFYVSCAEDKTWIKRHCRVGRGPAVTAKEPSSRFCRQIIENNLDKENDQLDGTFIYSPGDRLPDRKRMLHKLDDCFNELSPGDDDASETLCDVIGGGRSCDTDSLTQTSLSDDVKTYQQLEKRKDDTFSVNLGVVQSNLTRPDTLFVETQRSVFQL